MFICYHMLKSEKSLLINITNTIIFINIIVFLLQQQNPDITVYFGMNYLFITENLWFQPLTSMFLHGSWMHLGMNMIVLFQFGTLIERHLGKMFFITTYIIGGTITSILSLVFMAYVLTYANMIGASGALSVLFGVFGFLNPTYLKGLGIAIVIMSFAPLLMGINIAWYAHLIGFGVGIAIAFVYRRVKYGV